MNFQEFQATGHDVEDVSIYNSDDEYKGVPGRVYNDGLWIQRVSADDWYCIVFNEDIIGRLEQVEQFLYDRTFTDGVCCI